MTDRTMPNWHMPTLSQGGHPQRRRDGSQPLREPIRPGLGGFRAANCRRSNVRLRKTWRAGRTTVWNALELLRRIVNFGRMAGCAPRSVHHREAPKDNEVVEYLEPEQAARFMRS
jgi:hypothetical protein